MPTHHPIDVVKTQRVETEDNTVNPNTDSDATESYEVPATQEPSEKQSKTVEQPSKKHVFVTKTIGLVKHKRNRVFKCKKCDRHFPTMSQLNSHYKDNQDPVKCYVCHRLFNTPSTLDRHLYLHEIATKKCRCGKLFRFKSELESHKLTHQHIRRQKCSKPSCNKSYFSANDLAKHVHTHRNIVWNCKNCDYTTKDEHLLKSHRHKHDQLVKYTCQKCGRGFVYYTQWARHKEQNNCVELKRSDSLEI